MTDRREAAGFRVLACPERHTHAAIVVLVAGTLGGPECALADRVESVLARGHLDVVVDVGRLDCPDVATAAALARLQLRMRARGGSIRLRGASPDFVEVLHLLGLDVALPTDGSA